MLHVKLHSDTQDKERSIAVFDGKTAAQRNAIMWIEDLLIAMLGREHGLLSALNELQASCRTDKGEPIFPDKFKIPLYLVNLVLKPHGIWLQMEGTCDGN